VFDLCYPRNMPDPSPTLAQIRITVWRIYHERDPRYSRFPMGRELIERREVPVRAGKRAFLPNDAQHFCKKMWALGYQVVTDPIFVDPDVVAVTPISQRVG